MRLIATDVVKTDKPIERPFGVKIGVGSTNHIGATGEYDGSICAAAAMRPIATITITTCTNNYNSC